MSHTATTLTWSVKRGTVLTASITWQEDGANRSPTEVLLNIRDKPAGAIQLTLAVGSGVILSDPAAGGKRADITISAAQSAALPIGHLPFDIVPTIDGVTHTADAIDGTLNVTREQGDI